VVVVVFSSSFPLFFLSLLLLCACYGSASSDLLLASGSQDHKVRLWRIASVEDPATLEATDAVDGGSAAASGVEAFIATLTKPKAFSVDGVLSSHARTVVVLC